MKNMIFLGAPAAGKGTIAAEVLKKYPIPQISTGDMLREAVANGTEVGLEAKKFMDEGKLVPDEVIIKIVEERLKQDDCKDGFLLDGFPRTLAQAEALAKITDIDLVVNLECPKEVIIQRVTGRRICRKCAAVFNVVNIPPKVEGVCDKCGGELYQRDDDNLEAIETRLDTYDKMTAPLIKFYEEKGVLKRVDAGAHGVEAITKDTLEVVGS